MTVTVVITDTVTGTILVAQDANLDNPFDVVDSAVKRSAGGPLKLQLFEDGVCKVDEVMLPPVDLR